MELDRKRVQEFARKLFGHYTSGMLALMVDVGHKTGLFEAAAKGRSHRQSPGSGETPIGCFQNVFKRLGVVWGHISVSPQIRRDHGQGVGFLLAPLGRAHELLGG